MKRIIVVFLLLAVCFSVIAAHAVDTKELTCQGVPWFSTPEEASDILHESGFISKAFDEKDINKGTGTRNWIKKTGNPYLSSSIAADTGDKECPYTYVSESHPTLTRKLQAIEIRKLPKTIAKAKVSSFYLNFTADEGDRKLVECKLTFQRNKDYSWENIYNALKQAFGKETIVKDKYFYIWYGENNTIVIFNLSQSNVTFATIDGLKLAETVDVELPESKDAEPEDTGF